ncbi:MAG: hypothetical protein K6T65_03825 [Peptococcaceae bacterium]|nr:hypothetical protein [Peptococcaceae bacterium]
MRKKEDYYEPLTPQGVVNLKKNEYSRKTGDPINGQLILKQFDIADPKISPEERSEFEKFILKNSLFISPDNVPQATFSPIGLTMEKTVILFLILSFMAVAGLRFARRSKRE